MDIINLVKNSKTGLFAHQDFAVNYMKDNDNINGIVLAYTMGAGKTRTAKHISDLWPERDIIIFAPKALHSSISNEFGNNTNIHYITSNSGQNLKHFKNTINIIKKKHDLKDAEDKDISNYITIVMDEAHLISSSISNKILEQDELNPIYRYIMNLENSKRILLTGTPMINKTFELVPLFNFAIGYIDGFDAITMNPIEWNNFENDEYFELKLASRINKYILYFDLPKLPTFRNIKYVKMGSDQEKQHYNAFLYEKKMNTMGKTQIFNSYTRQICEYANPNLFFGESEVELPDDKLLTDNELIKHGTAMYAIVDDIVNKRPHIKHVIYSEFVRTILIYQRALELRGYKNLNEVLRKGHEPAPKDKYFATLTGDESDKIKDKILKINNASDGGKLIRVVLFTRTAAQGIDLYSCNVSHLHPQWTPGLVDQIQNRISRIGGTQYLPKELQWTEHNMYISISNIVKSGDLTVFESSNRKEERIRRMINILKASSPICPLVFQAENEYCRNELKNKRMPKMRSQFNCYHCFIDEHYKMNFSELTYYADILCPNIAEYEIPKKLNHGVDMETGLVYDEEHEKIITDHKLILEHWDKVIA